MGERESRDLDDMKKSCKGFEAERGLVTSECLKKSAEAETNRGRREVVGQGWQEVAPSEAARGPGDSVTALLGG